jgi:cofilin
MPLGGGVKLDEKCVTTFNEFKLSNTSRYLIFGFNADASKIVILHQEQRTKTDEKNPDWNKFVHEFPDDDVRYAVVFVDYKVKDGPRTNMIFIKWAPSLAPIRKKMLVASSESTLRNALVGCSNHMQAGSYPDLDLKNVLEQFKGAIV